MNRRPSVPGLILWLCLLDYKAKNWHLRKQGIPRLLQVFRGSSEFLLVRLRSPRYYAFYAYCYTASAEIQCLLGKRRMVITSA